MDRYTSLVQSSDTSQKLRANMPLRKWLKPQNEDGLLNMMVGYYASIVEVVNSVYVYVEREKEGGL
jgi:hypothetical protein